MTELTPEQRLKKTERQALHFQRQRRMPPDSRPRLSPRDNMPGRLQEVHRTEFVSCRVCIEHPERYPNDFRYLFQKAHTSNDPVFVWLDIDGKARPSRTYPSIFQAIAPMVRQGWEDASW